MKRTTRITITLLLTTVAACGQGGYSSGPTGSPPPGDQRTVTATPSLTFGPSVLTVSVGDEVTFDFGSVPHNVFFDEQGGSPPDIEGSNANVSIKRGFRTAGTFHYTCHIHPSMQGTVVVR